MDTAPPFDLDALHPPHRRDHDMTTTLRRRAAALMRERASAATPGRWRVETGVFVPTRADIKSGDGEVPHRGTLWVAVDGEGAGALELADAEYIASWPPAVATIVAALLDGTVDVDTVARVYMDGSTPA